MKEKQFKNKRGDYKRAVKNVLNWFNVRTVSDLRTLAIQNEIVPFDIFRFRGMGNKFTPGKLAQEIFNLPSAEEKRNKMILNNLGDGI